MQTLSCRSISFPDSENRVDAVWAGLSLWLRLLALHVTVRQDKDPASLAIRINACLVPLNNPSQSLCMILCTVFRLADAIALVMTPFQTHESIIL